MRSTVYAFPQHRGVCSKVGIDLAVLCNPLGLPSADYTPPPRELPDGSTDAEFRLSQTIPLAPPKTRPGRCSDCNAYENPFWGADGACNLCETWDSTGTRPTELGCIEYDVGGAFVVRKQPVAPVSLYAADATSPHLQTYLETLTTVGVSMGEHFLRQSQSKEARAKPRIGVVLVGSFGVVVVYRDKEEWKMTVMSDVTEDPYCHIPQEEWTFDVTTESGIQAWKEYMAELWTFREPLKESLDGRNAYGLSGFAASCGGAAMAFMVDAMAQTGGRCVRVCTCVCSFIGWLVSFTSITC